MTLILKLVLFNLVVISAFAAYLPLDGDEWHAVNQNRTLITKAKVPGSIYSDLRRQGILKEDIYKGFNDVNYRWVSYDNWTYERTFQVDTTILNKQRVDLVANGIDTVSTVYINDKVVGNTNNQFIRYKFDVKHLLKSGENKIRVEFESAVHYGKRKSEEYKQKHGYDVPPDCTDGVQKGECHYNFIRKMQSSYSWDWGPAFPTQGIWKPIGIEAYDKAIIRDITVETTFKDDLSKWTLNVNLFIESAFNKEFDAILTISLDERQLLSGEKHKITPSADGTASVKLVFNDLKQITPWFPNGVANNTQKLYDLKVNLSFPNSTEVGKQSKRIGFRRIELVQEPLKPSGLSFYFRVNGVKFWAKGSNWIPAHVLMEELTPQYLTQLMSSANKANMNFMRVWGGGVYESDLFYELADDLGIMIWQDFMFACALYPTDKDFLNSVDIEVRQQVRRLQHHPSIAIWAGNNENESAVTAPWYPVVKNNESLYKKDYVELYINQMKPIILSEDKTRPYVSSSPSNGLEDEKEKWTAKNPQDERYGDVHYYNYNGKLWDWKFYPHPKFASEYGFQSYPSLEAFNEVLDKKEFTYPVSKAVNHRQHHGGGEQAMDHQAGLYFKLPTHGGSDRFNDLIYLSQITQAMAMKTETEHYRRTRAVDSNGKGNTMGAFYWQLNDIWQAPTWASIEFGGKWKALHYYAKNFLNNLLVSPFEDNNQTKLSLIRDDYLGDLDIDLSVKVYKWSETKPIHEINEKIKTKSFSAEVVYSKSIPDLLKESKCVDRTECVLSIEVKNSAKKLEANNFMLLTEPKNSKLHKPNIKVIDIKKKTEDVFDITLSSEAVAPFVYLDFKLDSGIKGHFSDNGFFIFSNHTVVEFITVTKNSVTVEKLKENLTIKSVTDVI